MKLKNHSVSRMDKSKKLVGPLQRIIMNSKQSMNNKFDSAVKKHGPQITLLYLGLLRSQLSIMAPLVWAADFSKHKGEKEKINRKKMPSKN